VNDLSQSPRLTITVFEKLAEDNVMCKTPCHESCHYAANYTVSKKNVLTLKRYSSELQGAILMQFGRNIQNTLE